MPRWDAGAETRLTRAAYELYFARGFENVTVAEIAARAGLTKRTFFRYFADKREVLFSGAPAFQDTVVRAIVDAPRGVAPIDAVVAALAAGGTGLTELGEGARGRQRIIDSSPDLQEREMIKMAALTAAIGGALQQREVPESAASLTAQAGVAIFQTAFERWSGQEGDVDFSHLMHEALDELRTAIRPADGAAAGAPPATSGLRNA